MWNCQSCLMCAALWQADTHASLSRVKIPDGKLLCVFMYYIDRANWIEWGCTAAHRGCIIFIESILDVRRCSKGIRMELQR